MMNNKTQEGERRNLFTDDLTFALVMRDEAICKGLLERILLETEFGEIRLTTKNTKSSYSLNSIYNNLKI